MKKKCVNNSSKILSLDYTISKEGISPDQALTKKTNKTKLKIATPTN